MKNLLFVLLSATLILGSCTKDNNSPRLAEEEALTDALDAYQSYTMEVLPTVPAEEIEPTVPNDCEYYPCFAEMADWMNEHQAIADATCKTQTESIVCCMGEFWVVLHLEAKPKDLDCGGYKEIEGESLDVIQ